jgi:hypothetical protein
VSRQPTATAVRQPAPLGPELVDGVLVKRVDPQLGQFAVAEGRAVGAWPTNDGLTMTYGAWPVAEFHARGDVDGNVLRTLDLVGDRGERVRAGRRAERFRASPDLPNCFRRPWARAGPWSGMPAW